MTTIVSIVEGDGEVAALPVLLRRIAEWRDPDTYIHPARPIRVRRDQFLNRPDVFERQLRTAANLCIQPGWILILLDADDDCPMELAEDIRQRAQVFVRDHFVSVVLANREFEAWFIASAKTLNGKRGFVCPDDVPEPESVRGAKQWISRHIPNGAYHEILDQPAFSAQLDIQSVYAASRSFRKLCDDWTRAMNHLGIAGQLE